MSANLKHLTDFEKQIHFINQYGLSGNDLCLCGSGEVFKKCCMGRITFKDDEEVLARTSMAYNNRISKKDLNIFTCLYGACESASIKSHLFSKGTHIKFITDNQRQVRKYSKSIRNGKCITLNQRLQRKEASTFRGFCIAHDNGLFHDIDNNFDFRKHKLYALTYRCIGYHLRKIETSIRVIRKSHFKEVPMYYSNKTKDLEKLALQVYLIKLFREYEIQLRSMERLFKAVEQNYDSVSECWTSRYDILRFSRPIHLNVVDPKILFSNVQLRASSDEGEFMAFDAGGRFGLDHIITMILPNRELKGVDIIFAAHRDASLLCHRFIDNIEQACDFELCSVLNNLILSNLDEFYFTEDMAFHDWGGSSNYKVKKPIQSPRMLRFDRFDFERLTRRPSFELLRLVE